MQDHNNNLIEQIIQLYNLKPHIEGGFSQLLYEDELLIRKDALPKEFKESRSSWNAIYYLLPRNSKCIFHKIKMSELWNFYLGGALELFDISPSGKLTRVVLGHDISVGQQLAYVFPKNHWIGAKPLQDTAFSFVSCVTSPGFTFADWEKGEKELLLDTYPHLCEVINMLT